MLKLPIFIIISVIITIEICNCTVYFNCNHINITNDHLKVCKFFQSMNLRDIGIDLDSQTNYCDLTNSNFEIECDGIRQTIEVIGLRGVDFRNTDYVFNYTDNLGLPSSLIEFIIWESIIDDEFNFDYIYSLNNTLEILILSDSYITNRRRITGVVDWNRLLTLTKLRELWLFYNLFDINATTINAFPGTLTRVDVC